jgi:hypothetical protein
MFQHGNALPNLYYAVSLFVFYNCEDPRDKVYGLNAFVHKDSRVEVDYSKSVEEVFLEAIRVISAAHMWNAETGPVFVGYCINLGKAMLPRVFRDWQSFQLPERGVRQPTAIAKKIAAEFAKNDYNSDWISENFRKSINGESISEE